MFYLRGKKQRELKGMKGKEHEGRRQIGRAEDEGEEDGEEERYRGR